MRTSTLKIAPSAAALAVLLLLVAACGGGGGEGSPTVGPATPTPLATPTPIPTVTPDVIDRVGVTPLQFGEEAEIPKDVALIIETGCYYCDGPSTGLYRVYRDASGQVRTDALFTIEMTRPEPDQSFIHSHALNSDASEIVVSVCSAGACEWMAPPIPEDQMTLFRSLDGGVTWTEFGVLHGTAWVVAITKDGVLLVQYDSEQQAPPKYRLFPGNEPVQPPAEAGLIRPLTLADGELAWLTENGRLLRSDGSQVLALQEGASLGSIAPDTGDEHFAVAWWTQQPKNQYRLGVFSHDGRPISAFSLSGFARLGGWLSDTLVAGNVTVPQALLPTPEAGRYVMDFQPAIFDLQAGEAHPLAGPFQQSPFGGRNFVQAVLRGPFARVVNTGSCLNIRAEPGTAAGVLTCAADGVLLRDTGETQEADGATWLRVVTPAGAEGWATTQYLQR